MATFRLPLILTLGVTLLLGCRSPEPTVTVIEKNPLEITRDTSATPDTSASNFMQLTVGEIHPIKSMDPLFASNTSTKRFILQVYEGLVRYNEKGEIEPAIASDWSISDDSLTYRFHLRSNVYYHDSDIFAAGTGQRVVSDDFRFIFRRMTRMQVPPDAARLFMNIEGFEPYYREQHRLYDPDDRKLEEISGLRTPNDSTFVIHLRQPDPHLLQKLASPYAVVYPREAIRGSPDRTRITRPVGSGPFQFSKRESSNEIILSRFNGYWMNKNAEKLIPRLSRVDIVHASPSRLLKRFNDGEIDVIAEMAPRMMQTFIDSTGSLTPEAKKKDYKLYRGGQFSYRILYNRESPLERQWIERKMQSLNFSQITNAIHPSAIELLYKKEVKVPADQTALSSTLEIPYSEDPFVEKLVNRMQKDFNRIDVNFRMGELRVPLQTTGIIADQQVPYYPEKKPSIDELTLVKFGVHHYALTRPTVRRYPVNSYPWWMNLRTVIKTEATETL